ncbi:MAG: carbon storage regulator [Succinivibrio sp.]|nr:carbon storage regulator [Succinivibrio sp.]
MLVISPKEGETFSIGGDIKVSVLEIKQGRVRLGIDAPVSLKISRTNAEDSPAEDGFKTEAKARSGPAS